MSKAVKPRTKREKAIERQAFQQGLDSGRLVGIARGRNEAKAESTDQRKDAITKALYAASQAVCAIADIMARIPKDED